MAKKKIKKNEPKKSDSSISYWIYQYLKDGVTCREELILKIHENFKNKKVLKNTKNRDISIKSIVTNVNEIIRYIFEERTGWYRDYQLTENKNILKIKQRVKSMEKIPRKAGTNGNEENTVHDCRRTETV